MVSDSSKRAGDGLTRCGASGVQLADCSSASSKFSQPNQAHLPSLKMLSERLGSVSGSKSVPSALSEMSTNVPAEQPTAGAGRLKLPASAVARAQLTPSPSPPPADSKTKAASVSSDAKPKEAEASSGADQKQEAASTAAKGDVGGAPAPEAKAEEKNAELAKEDNDGKQSEGSSEAKAKEAEATKDALAHKRVQESRASLGVAYRPQTPQRGTLPKTAEEDAPPEIVVQSSTPGKGEDGVEEGEVVETDVANSPALPLAHSWLVLS